MKWHKMVQSSLILIFLLGASSIVLAQSEKNFGLTNTATQAGFTENSVDPSAFAGNVIGILLGFTGVIFFGLMVYAGMIWLTARGNEDRVEKAKDIILSAVIGLVIIFAAYGITRVLFSWYNTLPQSTSSSSALSP